MIYWVNMGKIYNHSDNRISQSLAIGFLLICLFAGANAYAQDDPNNSPPPPVVNANPPIVHNSAVPPAALEQPQIRPETRHVRNKITIKRRGLTRAQHQRFMYPRAGQ